VKHPLEQLLEGCLAQLNTGTDLEVVLAAHPEVADELRPLLAGALTTQVDIPAPVRKTERKDAFLAQVAAHRRTVETVDGYVVEIKAGVPLAEVLERAPEALRPAVMAAWRMHSTPAPAPEPERRAAGKATIMALAARRHAERRAALSPSLGPRLRRGADALWPDHRRYRRVWSGTLGASMAVLVLFAGAAGLGSASASSLPGEAFYHVKRLGESAQLLFAFEPARRAELNLEFTDRRLREMQALSAQDQTVPLSVVEDWLRSQTDAWADIQGLPAAQRQALLKLLVEAAGTGDSLEARLRQVVSDPDALAGLLAQSAGLLRSVRTSDQPSLLPAAQPAPQLDLVPPARQQPVPVIQAPNEPAAERPASAPVMAPPAAVEPPAAAVTSSAPPIQAPPAEEPSQDEPDEPAASNPGSPPEPGMTPPVSSPAEPPPIIVPPLEDPNGFPSDPGAGQTTP
jgi:hypothetical protein